MLSFANILLLAAATSFNMSDWLAKRAVLCQEARRLRTAYRAAETNAVPPALGVVVPLETHPNGAVALEIASESAKLMLKENLVRAEGVVIRKLSPDGRELTRLEAKSCVFDRETKSGWVEGPMKLIQGQTTLSGSDVYFSSQEEYVMSFDRSVIDSRDLKFGGVF